MLAANQQVGKGDLLAPRNSAFGLRGATEFIDRAVSEPAEFGKLGRRDPDTTHSLARVGYVSTLVK